MRPFGCALALRPIHKLRFGKKLIVQPYIEFRNGWSQRLVEPDFGNIAQFLRDSTPQRIELG